jgi:hypothetical protein
MFYADIFNNICHHGYMVAMIPRVPLIPVQNRNRSTSFDKSVKHVQPRSNEKQTTFSYLRSGRGVQGETANAGSNPTNIAVRRRNGFTY